MLDMYERIRDLADERARKKPRVSEKSRAFKSSQDEGKAQVVRYSCVKNAGKLALFKDMPLDIIYEICSHLHPTDLLQLSRVSKSFRATFTNESLRSLWIAARRPLAVPDPLPSISELQYAAALFEHKCFACGVKRSMKVHCAAALRFCAACWKVNMVKGRQLLQEYSSHDADEKIYQLVPRFTTLDHSIEPEHHDGSDVYYAPDFEAECRKWHSLKEGEEKEWYLDERLDRCEEAELFALNVLQWEERVKEDREDEAMIAQEKRHESIMRNLLVLGYDPEDFPPRCLYPEWRSAIDQPRELTPQIWKRIQPIVEQAIEDWRREREAEERCKRQRERRLEILLAYLDFVKRVPATDGPYPTQLELVLLPVVEAMVREEDSTLSLTKERWQRVADALAEYKTKAKDDMVAALQDACTEAGKSRLAEGEADDVLQGAIALFQCPYCSVSIGQIYSSIPTANVYNLTELNKHVWSVHFFRPSFERPQPVADVTDAMDVIRAVGMDTPERTRYEEVTKRIVCKCDDPSFKQPATFSELVSHIRFERMYHEEYKPNFDLLSSSSSSSSTLTLHPDHSLTTPDPCIVLLPPTEPASPPRPLTDSEKRVIAAVDVHRYQVCALCWTAIRHHYELTDKYRDVVIGSIVTEEDGPPCPVIVRYRAEEVVRHVQNKHGREATVEDLMPFGSDPFHCRYWEPLPDREVSADALIPLVF